MGAALEPLQALVLNSIHPGMVQHSKTCHAGLRNGQCACVEEPAPHVQPRACAEEVRWRCVRDMAHLRGNIRFRACPSPLSPRGRMPLYMTMDFARCGPWGCMGICAEQGP